MINLNLIIGSTLLLINVSLVFSAGLLRPDLQVQRQNFNLDPRRLQLQKPGSYIPRLQGQGSFNNMNLNLGSGSGDALRTTNDLVNIGYHGVTKPLANAAVRSISKVGTLPLKLFLKPLNMDHIPNTIVDTALDIGNTIGDAVMESKDNLVDVNANLLDNAGAYTDEAQAALLQQAAEAAALGDQFMNEDDDRRSRRHSHRHSGRGRDSRRGKDSRRDRSSRRDRDSRRDNDSRRDRDSKRDRDSNRDRDSKRERDSDRDSKRERDSDRDSKRDRESNKRSGSKSSGKEKDSSPGQGKDDKVTPPPAGGK